LIATKPEGAQARSTAGENSSARLRWSALKNGANFFPQLTLVLPLLRQRRLANRRQNYTALGPRDRVQQLDQQQALGIRQHTHCAGFHLRGNFFQLFASAPHQQA
jgi:hypothetical protein